MTKLMAFFVLACAMLMLLSRQSMAQASWISGTVYVSGSYGQDGSTTPWTLHQDPANLSVSNASSSFTNSGSMYEVFKWGPTNGYAPMPADPDVVGTLKIIISPSLAFSTNTLKITIDSAVYTGYVTNMGSQVLTVGYTGTLIPYKVYRSGTSGPYDWFVDTHKVGYGGVITTLDGHGTISSGPVSGTDSLNAVWAISDPD